MKDLSAEIPNALLATLAQRGWKPGDRLPSTVRLAKLLGLPQRQVHYSLTALAAQGYLERQPGKGTVLLKKRRTPNAVIMFRNNLQHERAHSNRALLKAIREELYQRGYGLAVLDDFASLLEGGDALYTNRMEKLKERLEEVNPVGFLEINCYLKGYPRLYGTFKRPSVRFGPPQIGGDVYHDRRHLLRTALEYLAGRGRRKVAILRVASGASDHFAEDDFLWQCVGELGFLRCDIREVLKEAGMDLEQRGFELTSSLVAEWSQVRKNYVPDSLIVLDDVLMLGVAGALRQSSFDIHRDFDIVVQATEGIPLQFGVPVHRYELSRREDAVVLTNYFMARIARLPARLSPVRIPGKLNSIGEA